MFDRCRKWRARMDLLADGNLSLAHCADLQNHLQGCAACQSLSSADALRRDALRQHGGMLTAPESHSFDESVIAMLRTPAEPEPLSMRGGIRSLLRCLPTDFLQQLAGGAMAAATVTIICLFSALHPKPTDSRHSAAPSAAAHSEPPVALESLLRAHSPRAYSLWMAPAAGTARAPRPAPVVHRARPNNSGRHSAVAIAPRLS